MPNRRDFLRNAAGATAGAFLLNRGFTAAATRIAAGAPPEGGGKS